MSTYGDDRPPRRRDRNSRSPRSEYYDDDDDYGPRRDPRLRPPPPPGPPSDASTPRFRPPRPPTARRKSILIDPEEPPEIRHRRRESRADNVRLRASDDESEYAYGPPRRERNRRGPSPRDLPYPEERHSRHDLERKNSEHNRKFRERRDGYESEEGELLKRAQSFSPSRGPRDAPPPRARSRQRPKSDWPENGAPPRGPPSPVKMPGPEYVADPDLREGYVAADRLPKPPQAPVFPPPPTEPFPTPDEASLPARGKPRGPPSPVYDYDPSVVGDKMPPPPPPQVREPASGGRPPPPPAYPPDRDMAPVQRRRTVGESDHPDRRPRPRRPDDDYDDDYPPPRRRRDRDERLAPPRYPDDRDRDRGYGSDNPPPRPRPRRRDWDNWEDEYSGRDRRRPPPPSEYDDPYDRPPPRRAASRGARDRPPPRPRPDEDYYSDYREDRRPARRASLSDRDRYRRDPRDLDFDPRYDRDPRDPRGPRRESRREREKRKTWQEEAGAMFMSQALPIIKREGGRFLMKQAQGFLTQQAGGSGRR